jgi:hypothetical protein
LPANEVDKFPKGTLPIHQTIAYTDDALREFFAFAKTQAWYKHTTFVLTADHSAENETPYYQSPQGIFEVPLFVFRPDSLGAILHAKTVSHIDIMSLILYESHYADSFFTFGVNPNIDSEFGGAIQYHDMYYRLIQWPYVYHFDGQKSIALFNLTNDSLMKDNLMNLPVQKPKLDSMEHLLKSRIQNYNRSLINNKTLLPK